MQHRRDTLEVIEKALLQSLVIKFVEMPHALACVAHSLDQHGVGFVLLEQVTRLGKESGELQGKVTQTEVDKSREDKAKCPVSVSCRLRAKCTEQFLQQFVIVLQGVQRISVFPPKS